MNIKESIESQRPRLDESILNEIKLGRNPTSECIKGAIAEAYVAAWLSQLDSFERSYRVNDLEKVNGFDFEESERGILVKDNGQPYCELDNLVQIGGANYGVEVKALKLNGIAKSLERRLEVTRDITGDPHAGFLLFFPQYTNKVADAQKIEEEYPDVVCIDSGYKKKQMMNLVKEFGRR